MQFFPLPAVFVGGEIVDMISNSGAVAKLVLLGLLAFSLISWSIILTKWSLLRRARMQSGGFVRVFRKAQRLQDIAAVAEQFKPSPLVGVFQGGYEEYKRQAQTSGTIRNLLSIQRGMQIGGSEGGKRLGAPGISEALITTAAGLAAAIPAVIAYNLIGASIREFASRSDDFALEVLNAVEHTQAQAPVAEVRR